MPEETIRFLYKLAFLDLEDLCPYDGACYFNLV